MDAIALPYIGVPSYIFGPASFIILSLSWLTPSINYLLNACSGSSSSICRSLSSLAGRTKVIQSLYLKLFTIALLIFLESSLALTRLFWSKSASYKYYRAVNLFPSWFCNSNVKSLRIHKNLGMNLNRISSLSRLLIFSSARIFIESLVTTFSSFIDFSSIDPTLLYMKYDEISIANTNIFVSFSASLVKD